MEIPESLYDLEGMDDLESILDNNSLLLGDNETGQFLAERDTFSGEMETAFVNHSLDTNGHNNALDLGNGNSWATIVSEIPTPADRVSTDVGMQGSQYQTPSKIGGRFSSRHRTLASADWPNETTDHDLVQKCPQTTQNESCPIALAISERAIQHARPNPILSRHEPPPEVAKFASRA
ncbi:hypothetical protein CSPX01_07499 [Colletotrichum filicis]|nr:hypothetical protein CSPX01_07499 [Colletotrichum filicis]